MSVFARLCQNGLFTLACPKSVFQAADMFENLLDATLPSHVILSIRGFDLLPICTSARSIDCVTLETIGSQLMVSFSPTKSARHSILVIHLSAMIETI